MRAGCVAVDWELARVLVAGVGAYVNVSDTVVVGAGASVGVGNVVVVGAAGNVVVVSVSDAWTG